MIKLSCFLGVRQREWAARPNPLDKACSQVYTAVACWNGHLLLPAARPVFWES